MAKEKAKTTYPYGFGSTAIADIAKEARVPLGNVYYYFKTKDDIGGGIVEHRVTRFRKLLEVLDKAESPKERLFGFVDIKIKNCEELARSGCLSGPYVRSCKNTEAQRLGNRGCCSRRL